MTIAFAVYPAGARRPSIVLPWGLAVEYAVLWFGYTGRKCRLRVVKAADPFSAWEAPRT